MHTRHTAPRHHNPGARRSERRRMLVMDLREEHLCAKSASIDAANAQAEAAAVEHERLSLRLSGFRRELE